MELDKTIPIPLYYQLKEIILSSIKNGKYKVGEAIPTENELSEIYKISRTTVRQAITELVHEGWLYRVKSKGTFVQKPKINQSFVQALGSFNDQILQAGNKPHTELLNFKVIDAPESVAEELHVNVGSRVIFIHRRRFADNEPIVIVKTFLPYEKCKFILEHDLEKESLYPLLASNSNTQLYKIRRYIEAVEADENDVEHLRISSDKAIQYFTSVGFNMYDEPIEYSLARYRGDRNRFEVTISNSQT